LPVVVRLKFYSFFSTRDTLLFSLCFNGSLLYAPRFSRESMNRALSSK
jgi:hypothetical protein